MSSPGRRQTSKTMSWRRPNKELRAKIRMIKKELNQHRVQAVLELLHPDILDRVRLCCVLWCAPSPVFFFFFVTSERDQPGRSVKISTDIGLWSFCLCGCKGYSRIQSFDCGETQTEVLFCCTLFSSLSIRHLWVGGCSRNMHCWSCARGCSHDRPSFHTVEESSRLVMLVLCEFFKELQEPLWNSSFTRSAEN